MGKMKIDKKKLLWACQRAGCPGLFEALYVGLTEHLGFYRLDRRFQLPCGKNTYYRLLRRVRALMEGSEDDGEA